MPKAPACRDCNNAKSNLELYLTAVMPFGGLHPQAAENLASMVPKRLDGNRRRKHELAAGMKQVWVKAGSGLYQRSISLEFDGAKLHSWLGFVARGLAWHHWFVRLRKEHCVTVDISPVSRAAEFQATISSFSCAAKVAGNLGNGTIQYHGIRASDPPELTVWTLWMYGGIMLADEETDSCEPVETSRMWLMITGPPFQD